MLEVIHPSKNSDIGSIGKVIKQTSVDKVSHLKELIYDTIRTAIKDNVKDSNVLAEQKMDIKLSPSLKRNVNIIQIQNVIAINLVENMINMLEIIDSLNIDELEANKINHLDLDTDLDDFCELLINEDLKLSSFQKIIRKLYIRAAIMKSKTKEEAAHRLGIQRTYLSRLVTTLGLKDVRCGKGDETSNGLESE